MSAKETNISAAVLSIPPFLLTDENYNIVGGSLVEIVTLIFGQLNAKVNFFFETDWITYDEDGAVNGGSVGSVR